jgi:hypothetical protein
VQYDGSSYTTALANCNGSDAPIVAALKCSVPIAVLKVLPFNLAWGASVSAKVVAINSYGPSTVSTAGNGAILVAAPDAPVGLSDLPLVTNAN